MKKNPAKPKEAPLKQDDVIPKHAPDRRRRKRRKEAVNHPKHYNSGRFEVIDVIEDWVLGFNDGNAVKYIARAKHKGERLQDLEKAAWYLAREIATIKKAAKPARRRKEAK